MERLLIAATFGFIVGGGIARPVIDDAAFYYSETCARSSAPVNGRYHALTWDCRLADAWVYGDMSPAPLAFDPALNDLDDCKRAAIAPTDTSLEACYGPMI